MLLKTIEQKPTANEFAKARELIEIRGTESLTLQDRRILNLLYANAWPKLCDDVRHIVGISELRGNHKGGERVKDSVDRLMGIRVKVPDFDNNGKVADTLIHILSTTTITVNEDDPSGQVIYSFSPEMRKIIKDSRIWGWVQRSVVFAFTSKYALALYELIAARINLKHMWSEDFSVDELRVLLGVKTGSLTRVPNLLQRVIAPAVLEVNGLAEFGVTITPVRKGGQERGMVTGFRLSWSRKNSDELKAAYQELKQPKVGRMARLKSTAQKPLTSTAVAL